MFFARSQGDYRARKRRHSRPGLRINKPGKRNVGRIERIISVATGAGLVADGIRRMSVVGLAEGLVGAAAVHRGATGKCAVYRQLGISSASEPNNGTKLFERAIHVEESVTVERPVDEVYAFWRNFENLPRFMDHLESVQVIDDEHSHWTVRAPVGTSVEWDARIINEEPDRLIAWESLPGADVDNTGSVRFSKSRKGDATVVKVTLDYIPPAGRLGATIAKLFGEDPQQRLRDDLGKFRQILETSGALTTNGQTSGKLNKQKARTISDQNKAGALAGAAGADHNSSEAMPRPPQSQDSEGKS